MKKLVLIRHAKSSWKNTALADHDRPLNKRGERDAPFMGKVVGKKDIKADLLVSSTATRAWETAKAFAKKLDYKNDKILKEAELYGAETRELLHYIQQLPDSNQTVLLFSHNPGITSFVNYLTNEGIENVPTCGVCAVNLDVASWKDASAGSGVLEFFEFPKMYFKDSDD